MKKWQKLLIALAVLVVVAGGLYLVGRAVFGEKALDIFRASMHIPRPRPEVIARFNIGGVDVRVTNTAFSSLVAMLVLVLLAVLIRIGLNRKSDEERIKRPRGWQNLAEWAMGYVINLLEGAAGKGRLKKRPLGRMIFPLVGTLFIFIIFANWFSLVPLFSTLLVKPPFLPVEQVTLERVTTGDICVGDWLTLHATAGQATEPHFKWYVNGKEQKVHEEESAWLDYRVSDVYTLTVQVEAYNEKEGHHYGPIVASTVFKPLEGEAATAAGCGKREPTEKAEHEEHHIPGLVWFFGGDRPGEAVPLLRAPNSHLAITAGMAIVAIVTVQALGVVAHGPLGYLKHLATDAPGWMKPIMFPIHVVSELSRIISLSARLFGNLYGGDVLLAVIFNLLAPLVPALFFGIEAFFYYIQALLFSVLTTVYISLAVAGGHGEGQGH